MTDVFVFDFMRASGEVEKIAKAIIKTSGFDPNVHLEDIAQDVRVFLFESKDRLKEQVTSQSYQNAVIKHATIKALQPLMRERARQVEIGYPRWWIKENLEDLLDGLSVPTYAFQECKLTGTIKQVIVNGHTEQDLAVQADFNGAYLLLTEKQQEALSKPRETAADRAAHSKALDKLCTYMNSGNIKENRVNENSE